VSKLVQNLKYKKVREGIDPVELGKLIEQEYLKGNRKYTVQKKTFSPSSIGYGNGRCPRYWFMAFNGADFEEQNDAQGIANMRNGTLAHQRIEELFNKLSITEDTEREMTLDDPPVRGFIDLILEWNDETVVGEFKTSKQEVFKTRQAQMKPSPNHLLQVLIYMHSQDARYGFVMYENKNTQEILVLPIVMNERRQKILDNAFEWMRSTYKTYEEGTLPTRPFTQKSNECKRCPIRKQCWSGPEGEIDIAPMSVPRV
jgi:CRISPR/Cas system-associated exonuclease Cas4 (RecB family)